jgi:hypothetical protein
MEGSKGIGRSCNGCDIKRVVEAAVVAVGQQAKHSLAVVDVASCNCLLRQPAL